MDRHGTGVVFLVEQELAAITSAAHLSAVLERKRLQLALDQRAVVLSSDDLRSLDPSRGRLQPIAGVAGIRQAIREAKDRVITEVFDECTTYPTGGSVDLVRQTINRLNEELQDRSENPDDDPFWLGARSRLIDLGAAFAALIDADLGEVEERRIVAFEIRTASSASDAVVGGELWRLLIEYRLREVERFRQDARRRNAVAAIAMVVDQVISVDNIDPRDVYDLYDEPG
jgi:hypothetical protein